MNHVKTVFFARLGQKATTLRGSTGLRARSIVRQLGEIVHNRMSAAPNEWQEAMIFGGIEELSEKGEASPLEIMTIATFINSL